MHSAAAPARAPGVATPSGFRQPRLWRGLPRHPAPTGPPRSSGPGVSARSLPAPPLRGHPVAHRLTPVPSLHDPRHRSCTGSRLLAALAPSCRPGRRTPQTAAGRLEIRQGRRREPQRIAAAGRAIVSPLADASGHITDVIRVASPRITQRLYAIALQRAAASAGNGLRVAPGNGISGPQRSGPQLLHAAAAARAGLVAVVGSISGPQQRHGAAAARAGAKQGGPPSRAPAPAHPAQRRRGLGRVGLRRPGPASRRSPARAVKAA